MCFYANYLNKIAFLPKFYIKLVLLGFICETKIINKNNLLQNQYLTVNFFPAIIFFDKQFTKYDSRTIIRNQFRKLRFMNYNKNF